MADLTGEIIDGRYQLTRIVDSGGMATIYAAMDLRLDREVAVKIMHPHLANDENYVSRFIREAKAAAAISHPNIVAIQDQGWNQGGTPCVFIVMELIDGDTFRTHLDHQGRIDFESLMGIMRPALSALAAAHKKGIVHRDIKPENILIAKDGRIKIADFGLARGASIGQTMTAESSVVLGSVSYLAPEQVQRGVSDARSDVYSAGIVIFEALTGEKPFSGDDPVQVALKHVKERVPRLSQLISGVDPALDDLIYLATSSDPDERPSDAEDLLKRLNALSPTEKKVQLSLELDLPPTVLTKKTTERSSSTISPENNDQVSASASTGGKGEQVKLAGKRKLSKRVKRNRTITALLLVLFIVGGWYLLAGPGNRVVVPSVAGLSIVKATNTLTPLGLNVEISSREFSEEIDEGLVLRSDPAGGDRVSEGGTVLLIVSQGKERYTVPAISGLGPEDATRLIEDSNLKVGTVTERFSPDVEKGLIVSQSPAASARVKRDSMVDFVISKGTEEILFKSYLGSSGEQALNELNEQGFDVDVRYQFSETVPLGAVISQAPTANQPLPKGSAVILTISQGTEFVFIPNVLSLTREEARGLLSDLDLKVEVREIGSRQNKVVTNVAPKVGERVKRGSTVVVTVS
ncbi:MAG: Stk1 family PASTA domain-containing Ser/Thr kinase [Candidatus Nanopelagicaceae bacterium]